MKKIRDIMTKDVIFFDQEESIFDVVKTCTENNISGGPVLKEGRVMGVVSVSDIVRFMTFKLKDEKILAHDVDPETLVIFSLLKAGTDIFNFKKELTRISRTRVKDVMTKKLVTVSPDDEIIDAANLMTKRKVNRLLVIEKGKLTGIVARQDLIRQLVE